MKSDNRIFIRKIRKICVICGLYICMTAHFAAAETEVYFTPSLECENRIIGEIERSKKMEIAVYAVSNERIAEALIKAHEGGSAIRIVTDGLQARGRGSKIRKLKENGIRVRTNKIHRIEHNKFAVFDGRKIITGSYNWTESASHFNSENCLVTEEGTKDYGKRFEILWEMYKE